MKQTKSDGQVRAASQFRVARASAQHSTAQRSSARQTDLSVSMFVILSAEFLTISRGLSPAETSCFNNFFLCLSRACLGKSSDSSVKLAQAKKTFFRTKLRVRLALELD
eukprot:COSAG06_NODE_502_length_14953_cov_15.585297_17_plen_109_part_00